jgi:hypothetical protein
LPDYATPYPMRFFYPWAGTHKENISNEEKDRPYIKRYNPEVF